MLRHRVIPALLLRNESLVKTVQFRRFAYIGDPANTVRIFNELEVDELLFLDITATREGRGPNLRVIRDIANECFMPVAYGGGIKTFDEARAVFEIGIEKVAINSAALDHPRLITEIADCYGRQAVIVSIDEVIDWRSRRRVFRHATRRPTHLTPAQWALEAERHGAGEILLTAVAREGTWSGFDLAGLKEVTSAVKVPVIAHGGAGSVADIGRAIREGGASAVAVGSLVVYQRKGMGVLVNFPEHDALAACIG
jgi:imidazole glycerol-phosphate synthase subunit HisF